MNMSSNYSSIKLEKYKKFPEGLGGKSLENTFGVIFKGYSRLPHNTSSTRN